MNKEGIKIKRKSMRDEAYDILQDWIVTGEFEPGRKLKDSELSEMLGISRTPVREALLKLEDEGLIETKVNRWTMVSSVRIEQVEQVYPMVQTLEILAIEQGFENFNDKIVDKLEKINEQFRKELISGEKEKAYQSDFKFHDTIIALSNNIELTRILKSLKIKIKRMEVYYFEKEDDEIESYYEHKQIIEDIKSRNKENIKNSVWKNWENSLNRIKNKVKE